jgi:23S rRNA (cytidine1920-2'-O)/16S rRNA (cytidine1409-2'-O)-methyltransferase
MAGRVHAQDRRIDKPSEFVAPDCELVLKSTPRFVSRGGEKLDAALEALGVSVADRYCIDAGCSTGGFTDCLLARGAAHVVAIDVGYGEFAWKLRTDDRVTLVERTNVRRFDPSLLPAPAPDLLVADLSFIGLAGIIDRLFGLVRRGGDAVVLVKPQFELPRDLVAGGVVALPELHERAMKMVEDAARAAGATVLGDVASPLLGADGNRELFLHLAVPAS